MNEINNQTFLSAALPNCADRLRAAAMNEFGELCRQGASEDRRMKALINAMRATPHGAFSDSLEHGEDTWKHYSKLCREIEAGELQPAESPAWLNTYGRRLLSLQESRSSMETYLTFHDCGKAWALIGDEGGRIHYPEHAERSAEIWAQAGGTQKVCELMRKDMVLHTICADEAAEFAADPLAPSLLFAAFAEIQSNAASIFGGRESTSFKIKMKALTRRANAICRHLFPA